MSPQSKGLPEECFIYFSFRGVFFLFIKPLGVELGDLEGSKIRMFGATFGVPKQL